LESTLARTTPQSTECMHIYKCVYEGFDSETYECKQCGSRYKLYYEDMK